MAKKKLPNQKEKITKFVNKQVKKRPKGKTLLQTKGVPELYVMAKKLKNKSARHCVPSGLSRYRKPQLIEYIRSTKTQNLK